MRSVSHPGANVLMESSIWICLCKLQRAEACACLVRLQVRPCVGSWPLRHCSHKQQVPSTGPWPPGRTSDCCLGEAQQLPHPHTLSSPEELVETCWWEASCSAQSLGLVWVLLLCTSHPCSEVLVLRSAHTVGQELSSGYLYFHGGWCEARPCVQIHHCPPDHTSNMEIIQLFYSCYVFYLEILGKEELCKGRWER